MRHSFAFSCALLLIILAPRATAGSWPSFFFFNNLLCLENVLVCFSSLHNTLLTNTITPSISFVKLVWHRKRNQKENNVLFTFVSLYVTFKAACSTKGIKLLFHLREDSRCSICHPQHLLSISLEAVLITTSYLSLPPVFSDLGQLSIVTCDL